MGENGLDINCSKCRGKAHPYYIKGKHESAGIYSAYMNVHSKSCDERCPVTFPEHLHLVCKRCGYWWPKECLNHG